MRIALALMLTAGVACSVFAQPDKPAEAPAAQPAAGEPATPPAPKAVPVPDGPVVKKTELEGGLIAEDLKIGEGFEVKEHGVVIAHYHGTLKADGKVFDSSFERGEPIAFPLDGVIPGWQKGVPGMKIGGVRRLTIPSAMGYGAAGAGPSIPPNSDLVFVIQLVDALQVEDIKVGDGEAAEGTFIAATAHTCKDENGKEIDKADAAHPYIWLPGEMRGQSMNFDAMQLALTGMKVGGKRKIVVPKEMNACPPQLLVKRPQDMRLEIEVELVSVRNLPMR